MTEAPDRATISFAGDDVDLDDVDAAVERSEHATRSEWIREQIRQSLDEDE